MGEADVPLEEIVDDMAGLKEAMGYQMGKNEVWLVLIRVSTKKYLIFKCRLYICNQHIGLFFKV